MFSVVKFLQIQQVLRTLSRYRTGYRCSEHTSLDIVFGWLEEILRQLFEESAASAPANIPIAPEDLTRSISRDIQSGICHE